MISTENDTLPARFQLVLAGRAGMLVDSMAVS
jgi:hypothetical protein